MAILLPFQTFRVNTEDTEKHKTTNTHKGRRSFVIASIVHIGFGVDLAYLYSGPLPDRPMRRYLLRISYTAPY